MPRGGLRGHMKKEITKEYPVGLLYFSEHFGSVLHERLNAMSPFENSKGDMVKIVAEHCEIHEIPADYATRYRCIIDRASHYLHQGLGILMSFAYQGVHIVNNPVSFHHFIANKDAGYSMIDRLGIPVPRTYILPTHTNPGFEEKDFRFHRVFDWNAMMEDVGFPCYIKPAEGRGAFGVTKVKNMDELFEAYNQSGKKVMTVQQDVPTKNEWHVRCICVGRKIVPIKFIFGTQDSSRYLYDEGFLSEETGKRVVEYARVINRAFGYEMNSVEFIVDPHGVPWAIDFNNPIPDGRLSILGEIFFNDYVNGLVELVRDKAWFDEPAPFIPPLNELAEIARQDVSKEERFAMALKAANRYYEPEGLPA